ncbi:MAG: DNA/RNA nuclease SfsA [Myxococcales bacterium]|nr:DNA/RNA nuclease SfsA [Myxococcales bacterium]
MNFDPPLVPGRLVRRYKRFLADVTLDDGRTVVAHCANTGAMRGIQVVGGRVYLQPATHDKRKLRWTWKLMRVGHHWVHVDAQQGSKLVIEAIQRGRVPGLQGPIRTEVPLQSCRIDLHVAGTWVEVKGTTMVRDRVGLFPDAVTTRGLRHVQTLTRAARDGERAAVVLAIQRDDVDAFSPADDIHPEFGSALRTAADCGVRVIALAARVSPTRVELMREVPVRL